MVNKKGYMRILEAFIAIMLLAAVLTFIVINQSKGKSNVDAIKELESVILQKIASDPVLRQAVLTDNEVLINQTLAFSIPSSYDYLYKICAINEVCKLDHENSYYTQKEIVSDGVSVSSSLTTYNPKQIKLFIWEKV